MFIHACSEFPGPNDPHHIAARGNVIALRESIADHGVFAAMYTLIMQVAIVAEVIHRDYEAVRIAQVLIRDALPATTV